MADSTPESTAAKSRRIRTPAKTVDQKKVRTDGRIAATLLLPESVDFRLSTIAKSLKSDRSTLAAQLIDAGLRRYALDAALRQHVGGDAENEQGRAGE
jgi:predicted transcriptional regulator